MNNETNKNAETPTKLITPADRVRNEWSSQPVAFSGAVVALGATASNLVYSAPTLFSAVPTPVGLDTSLIVRLILFIILEACIAYAVGVIFVWLSGAGKGFPYILTIVFALISAWISGFNTFWLFVANSEALSGAIGSFLAGIISAFLIAWYFIYHHYDTKYEAVTAEFGQEEASPYDSGLYFSFWMQLLAFIFIAFHLGLKLEAYVQAQAKP